MTLEYESQIFLHPSVSDEILMRFKERYPQALCLRLGDQITADGAYAFCFEGFVVKFSFETDDSGLIHVFLDRSVGCAAHKELFESVTSSQFLFF